MISDMVIKEALISAYDREIESIDKEAASFTLHVFSDYYKAKMQSISKVARYKYVTVMHRRRRLALVVAAIIALMIAATVITIAIVRPQIFYHITKGIGSWDYTFTREDPNELAGEFEYKKPKVPEGYEIVEENKGEGINDYDIHYQNDKGGFLDYYQCEDLSGLNMGITDTAKKKTIKINGKDATLYTEDDVNIILWDDGYSVYMMIGNLPKQVMINMAEKI